MHNRPRPTAPRLTVLLWGLLCLMIGTMGGASAQTWTPIYDSAPASDFGTARSAVGAGGTLVNGWKDVSGSVWQVSGGFLTNPVGGGSGGQLVRPASESSQNQRIVITAHGTAGALTLQIYLRSPGDGSASGYDWIVFPQSNNAYLLRNGSVVVSGASTSPIAYNSAHDYTFDASASGGTIRLVITDVTASNTVTVSYTDASPLTASGNSVVAISGNGGDAGPLYLSRFQTYVTGTFTTSAFTAAAADFWDNDWVGTSAVNVTTGVPMTSAFARLVYTTDASSMAVGTYSPDGAINSVNVRVNGADYAYLSGAPTGAGTLTTTLPVGTKTVEIVSGQQNQLQGGGILEGCWVSGVTFNNVTAAAKIAPAMTNTTVVLGDSIAVGGAVAYAEKYSWPVLLRSQYPGDVTVDAWGANNVSDIANTSGMRAALAARLAQGTPARLWVALMTNDYGLNKQSAASYGSELAALLDAFHGLCPSAQVILQTALTRGNEAANGNGNTLGNYRSQAVTVAQARPWVVLVDGTKILNVADLYTGDLLHPSQAGQDKYHNFTLGLLSAPAPAPRRSTGQISRGR